MIDTTSRKLLLPSSEDTAISMKLRDLGAVLDRRHPALRSSTRVTFGGTPTRTGGPQNPAPVVT